MYAALTDRCDQAGSLGLYRGFLMVLGDVSVATAVQLMQPAFGKGLVGQAC